MVKLPIKREIELNGSIKEIFIEEDGNNIIIFTKGKSNLFTFAKPPSYITIDSVIDNYIDIFKHWVEDER